MSTILSMIVLKLTIMKPEMTINARLKMLRTENGLTQAELAKSLGIGQTTVAAYENSHTPNIYSLIAYADFFECSLDYLAGREVGALPYALSSTEQEMIRTFRSLKKESKEYALEQLKLLAAYHS